MVGTYFVGVPLVVGFSFGTYGLIRNVEQETVAASSGTVKVIRDITYPAFHNHITKSIDDIKDNITKKEFIDDFLEKTGEDNSLIQNEITSSVLNYAVDFATDKLVFNAAGLVGVDGDKVKGTLSAIANGNIEQFHDELFASLDGFIVTTVERVFSPYYFLNIVLFVVLMFIPITEMIVSGIKIKRESKA